MLVEDGQMEKTIWKPFCDIIRDDAKGDMIY